MSYPYTDYRWHSAYQAVCKRRDNESLRYVIEDCRNAIRAYPENPKCEQYQDEIHYCAMELTKRRIEL